MRKALCLLAMALVFTGCARMVVRKHPGPKDTGIRFYRPKPYLFIGPAGAAKEGAEPVGEQLTMLPVVMRVEYLPDYSEEYSIKMRPGLGTTKLTVALQDGWNLTSVNAETDQQYDEILKSVADIIGSVGGLVGGRSKATYAGKATSDVPLGYYEAVLACNECGTKEMIGWRYVGFMMGVACPVKATVMRDGYECGQEPLYKLVFKDKTLMMERMDECADCPASTTTSSDESAATIVEDRAIEEAVSPKLIDQVDDAELPPLPQSSRPRRAKPR